MMKYTRATSISDCIQEKNGDLFYGNLKISRTRFQDVKQHVRRGDCLIPERVNIISRNGQKNIVGAEICGKP